MKKILVLAALIGAMETTVFADGGPSDEVFLDWGVISRLTTVSEKCSYFTFLSEGATQHYFDPSTEQGRIWTNILMQAAATGTKVAGIFYNDVDFNNAKVDLTWLPSDVQVGYTTLSLTLAPTAPAAWNPSTDYFLSRDLIRVRASDTFTP